MVSLSVPGIAKIIQSILMNFVYLDLLQTDKWLIPWIFPPGSEIIELANNELKDEQGSTYDTKIRLDETPINYFFEENGFSSRLLIKNMGSTFIYLIILVFLLFLSPVLTFLDFLSPM
jgi:hypothetical protein